MSPLDLGAADLWTKVVENIGSLRSIDYRATLSTQGSEPLLLFHCKQAHNYARSNED